MSKQVLNRLARKFLEVCDGFQKQSQTIEMDSGGSLNVETSLNSFGTEIPESLRGCRKQSQTIQLIG